MSQTLKKTRFIPAEKEEVFLCWIRPELLEKWSSPEGLELKVVEFEARAGGIYRYEHVGPKGTYVCTGYLREYIPNEKLVHVDTVTGPDGEIMFDKLEGATLFQRVAGGTELIITQTGFPDEDALRECGKGWDQSLDKLEALVDQGALERLEDRASSY